MDDDFASGRPQVAGVKASAFLSGHAVALARDAANEAIHKPAKRSAVEGSHIAPDSRFSQETLFNRCDQMGEREGFPLHQHDRVSRRQRQSDAEIEPAASGAEADDVEAVADGM